MRATKDEANLVTVLVVTWQGAGLLPDCLGALRRQTVRHHVLVIDNASTDGTAALLRQDFPEVALLRVSRNVGFSGGVDLGLRHVSTPYVALLNNDAIPDPRWLEMLCADMAAAFDVGAVGSKVLLRGGADDGRVNSAGGALTRDGFAYDIGFREEDGGRFDVATEVAYAPGTAVLLRMAAVADVGPLPMGFFLYYEDVDLCWRLWLGGWRVRYQPAAVVTHALSATVGHQSPLHTFHDSRNRLLTLARNAEPRIAVREIVRFPITTLLRLRAGEDWNTALVRARAYGSFVTMLPAALGERRRVQLRRRRVWFSESFMR